MAGPKFVIEVVPPRHDGCLPGFRQHLVELLVAAHVTAGLGALRDHVRTSCVGGPARRLSSRPRLPPDHRAALGKPVAIVTYC